MRVVEQALALQPRDEAEDLAVALARGSDDELGRRSGRPHAAGDGIEPRVERVSAGQFQRGQQVARQILLARQHADVGVGGRLEIDGDAIGQRARRLHLGPLGTRKQLQVHVPAKAVTAPQDLDRREHAIHGARCATGHARGEKQAIRRTGAMEIHEGCGDLLGGEGGALDLSATVRRTVSTGERARVGLHDPHQSGAAPARQPDRGHAHRARGRVRHAGDAVLPVGEGGLGEHGHPLAPIHANTKHQMSGRVKGRGDLASLSSRRRPAVKPFAGPSAGDSGARETTSMSESGEIIWRPAPSFAEKTRIAAFMKRLGVASLAELQRRSVEDPEWYWRAVSDEFALRWTKPFRRVLDTSRGIAWPRWFEGGEFNFAVNCLDRHLDAGRGAKAALVWESDAGETRTLTYAELARETARVAHGLRRLGVGAGDRVGIFLPMCPEAVIATLAAARIGAIYTPCFSGYGAQAVASRLQDCEAKVLITADSFERRGHVVRMKQTADEAADASPSVRHVVVVRRQGADVPWIEGRDVWWEDVAAEGTAGRRPRRRRPTRP